MENKNLLNLDAALEEVAKKIKPSASVYTISPSNCETQRCGPQCDCCSSCPSEPQTGPWEC